MRLSLAGLLRVFVVCLMLILAFFLGTLYQTREFENSVTDSLTTRTSDGFQDNSLSQIRFLEIFGLVDGNRKIYGTMLIRDDNTQNKTEIYMRLENVPSQIILDNKTVAIPRRFRINIVNICCNGLDYSPVRPSENLIVNLDGKDNSLGAVYSTVLDYSISSQNADRVLLDNDQEPNKFRISRDSSKDWTRNALEKPAPYFWINLR